LHGGHVIERGVGRRTVGVGLLLRDNVLLDRHLGPAPTFPLGGRQELHVALIAAAIGVGSYGTILGRVVAGDETHVILREVIALIFGRVVGVHGPLHRRDHAGGLRAEAVGLPQRVHGFGAGNAPGI